MYGALLCKRLFSCICVEFVKLQNFKNYPSGRNPFDKLGQVLQQKKPLETVLNFKRQEVYQKATFKKFFNKSRLRAAFPEIREQGLQPKAKVNQSIFQKDLEPDLKKQRFILQEKLN